MMAVRSLLAFALLIFLVSLGSAPSLAREIRAIELTPGRDADNIHDDIWYAQNRPPIAEAGLSSLLNASLSRLDGPAAHFGPPGAPTSVVLRVRNRGDAQGSWIFTTGRGSLAKFRLYEFAGDKVRLLVDNKDVTAVKNNLRAFQSFSSELLLDPGQEKFLVIEFRSENSTHMPLQIRTYGHFFSDRRANVAMVAGIAMAMLVLTFLNALFYSITGHKEFGWLALAQVGMMLSTVHGEGYFNIFFLSDRPITALVVEDTLKCAFAAAMIQFGREFLKTRRNFPRLDTALKLIMAGALLLMLAQLGLYVFPPAVRTALHAAVWAYTALTALFMPLLGYHAVRRLGLNHWPLLVGWASLAFFILYAGVASMGVFSWLPINWHLAGPVALFESLMVTIALGLNLRRIQMARIASDNAYAQSILERLSISERATRLAEEKAFALQALTNQSALLHASGHDSKQVILALTNAIAALKSEGRPPPTADLIAMLESSADYLNEVVSSTMSGANFPGIDDGFVALSCFEVAALLSPLQKMFQSSFDSKGLRLSVSAPPGLSLFTDRPMLMRALANLLGNAQKFTDTGGATLTMDRRGADAVFDITDTGPGMSDELVATLLGGTKPRLRADERTQGSGSGFFAAKRLIERLGGALDIVGSTGGAHIRVTVPIAASELRPCTQAELQQLVPGWRLADFDRRPKMHAGTADDIAAALPTIALTYDDTPQARADISAVVPIMIIKPLYDEMAAHPLLKGA
jgi:signal transduction histidine kinase